MRKNYGFKFKHRQKIISKREKIIPYLSLRRTETETKLFPNATPVSGRKISGIMKTRDNMDTRVIATCKEKLKANVFHAFTHDPKASLLKTLVKSRRKLRQSRKSICCMTFQTKTM